MRVVREPCKCCETGQPCCKMDSTEGLTFVPDEGFTLDSQEVENFNEFGCVAEAEVFLTVRTAGDPPASCPATNLGCGASCVNAYDSAGNLAGSRAASTALFDGWLGQFTPPEGWIYNGVGDAIPNSWPFSPPCSDLKWQFWGPDADCPGPCAAGTNNLLFRFVPDGELCFATSTERTNWIAGKHTEIQDALNAWYAQQEPLEFQIGDCWYQIKPIATVSFWPSSARTSCTYDKPSGTPNRYCVCAVNLRYLTAVAWQIVCSSGPCEGREYDWPLELDCGCTGEYEQDGNPTTPECKLYLAETQIQWHEDECYSQAIYQGRKRKGLVNCEEAVDDPDCICCFGKEEGP